MKFIGILLELFGGEIPGDLGGDIIRNLADLVEQTPQKGKPSEKKHHQSEKKDWYEAIGEQMIFPAEEDEAKNGKNEKQGKNDIQLVIQRPVFQGQLRNPSLDLHPPAPLSFPG
ncbi:MAG: hypothetical protein U5J82_05690 [Desulfobacterales bacterium]|nr:hypothetical protein [Desulfobacterales bacterium]